MLRKFCSLFCVVALSFALVGCDSDVATQAGDAAKGGVDAAADTTKDAADTVVPEDAKDTVDGAVDAAGEGAKDAIDGATGGGDQ
ncbi:MAG: hypothetical protein R3C53_01340 [Pirellulaceae bacterium]